MCPDHIVAIMLALHDLRKSFASQRAVDGVSLTVQPGQVVGLLGPNGAGKSTTIGLAVGLLTPDAGTVSIGSAGPPTGSAARALLGLAPQELALYEELSAEENVTFFARLFGLSGHTLRARVAAALELVGLLPRRHDRASTYSGGMKRRLNLAIALVHEPPIVLLDEPTAGVDPQSRNNLMDVVRALAAQGRAILYTTHYMEEASKLCDRVAIMDKGRILAEGTVPELTARYGGKSVVTIEYAAPDHAPARVETDDPTREVHRALSNGHASAVKNVRIDGPDLEAVFLRLTGRTLRD